MRPDPILKIDTAFFWEACERGEFVAQKCGACDILWHPPRPMCPKCHSTEKEVQQLSGLGTVVSWCVAVRPQAFGFDESPIAALIESDITIPMQRLNRCMSHPVVHFRLFAQSLVAVVHKAQLVLALLLLSIPLRCLLVFLLKFQYFLFLVFFEKLLQ